MPEKPKRAIRKEPGKCIFCGSGGLTHEHIWADWLRAYIPREMTEHRTLFALVSPDAPEEVTIQKRTGDPHSRRIRVVCHTCNSGWMSQLQNDVKPFLVPMLNGKRIRLHRRAQRILSAWIAMTVMVAEYINREYVAIPQEDRTHLKATSEAPKYWRIWIGAHRVQQHALYSHRTLELMKESEGSLLRPATDPNTQTTTMCVGEHFVFHSMSGPWFLRDFIRRWPLPASIAAELNQIWSIRTGTVTWPPRAGLTDRGMTLLADQFINAAKRFVRANPGSAPPPVG